MIGNEEMKIYQLLIYKQKTNILSSTKINPAFEFCLQKNNYALINDDKKVKWAIQFHNDRDIDDFAKTLSQKCLCQITRKEFLTISKELTLPIETTNETGPIVVENNHTAGSETKDGNESIDNADGAMITGNDFANEQIALKKASILSKVAKMGKKIIKVELPNDVVANQTELDSHSTEKDHDQVDVIDRDETARVDVESNVVEKISRGQLASRVDIGENNRPSSVGNFYPNPLMVSPSFATDPLQLFFIENRTHNSEFRMSLMKLQSNIDEILNKIKSSDDVRPKKDDKLQSENKKLHLVINKQRETINSLKTTVETYKKRNEDLIHSEAQHSLHIASLTEEAAKATYDDHKRAMKVKELERQVDEQAKKLEEYQTSLDKIHKTMNETVTIKKIQLKELHAVIKDLMNKFYDDVCEPLRSDTKYEVAQIKKALAPVIVDYTYEILKAIDERHSEIKLS